jgi:cell division protein FtsB
MSAPILFVEPWLAQTPSKAAKPKLTIPAEPANAPEASSNQLWMAASGGLLLLLIFLGIMSKLATDKLTKQVKFETFKNRELQKKLKFAVEMIGKMEKNPDLIHSREFNLDYLRMRMDEEVFHFAILNQIKMKVKDKISIALRPSQANQGEIGIASTGRQIDEIFDVEYEPGDLPKGTKRVLFRVEIKILKLPTQPTSVTIGQIIDCMETFLNPASEHDTWQPTIQGRIANMRWDQKAKPTPLLVLEQTQEGSNVTFKTTRMAQS